MKKKFIFIVFSFCLFGVSSLSFANDFGKKDIFYQLHAFGDSCISHVKENKFYLSPEKIIINSTGISLQTDYLGLLFLEELRSDRGGVYRAGWYDVYMCNGCGAYYTYEPSECGICRGSSFTRIDQFED